VLVALHLPKPVVHLGTALVRLNVNYLVRRSSLEAGSTRGNKCGRSRVT
jgi:hypothetical protein